MKYTNINAKNLLNMIDRALNELGEYDLNIIKNNFNNKNLLTSNISNNLDKTFNNIINSRNLEGSIATLKFKLNNLRSAANYIIKCQELEEKIKELETNLYNSDGSLNFIVKEEIDNCNNSINSYERNIDSLLNI